MKIAVLLIFSVLFSISGFSQTLDSLYLPQDTLLLKEVNITASYALNNSDVIDFYRSNHFATLDNINARLEGLSLIKRGAYAMEPQLNGFSGAQVNVTIDGMKMFGACTDRMDPITSYIEPTNLKNIKISHGSEGCSNGCSVGGTVDMSLHEPDTSCSKKLNTSIGSGYETNSNSRNLLFTTDYSAKKWSVGIEGVYRKNDNYSTANYREIPFSQFQKTNLHTVVKFLPDSFNSFKIDYLFDLANNVGYPALPMDVGTARANLLAFEYKRNKKYQLKFKMYINRIYHLMDDSKRDSLYVLKVKPEGKSDTVFMRMDMPGTSNTFGAYLLYSFPLNSKNLFSIKVDNYTNRSLAEMTMYMRYLGSNPERPMYMQTWPQMLRNVSGIFIQNSWFASSKWSVNINGRIDYNIDILESDYSYQEFSIFNYSLEKQRYTILKSLNLSSSNKLGKYFTSISDVGYSERMPSIGERLGFYLYNAYDGYDYIGDPYIKPEQSYFAKNEIHFSKNKVKINLTQSVSYVQNYIIGLIDKNIPAMNFYAKGIRRYSNITSAKLYSFDLQTLYSPKEYFSLFLLSKYTFGQIHSGKSLPLMPPMKNIIAAKYEANSASFQVEYESALEQNRINVEYGEQKTPTFMILNLKSGYKFHYNKSTILFSFGITNLFNKNYYEHLDWGRIYRPGRSFTLFCKIDF